MSDFIILIKFVKKHKVTLLALFICTIFFVAYSALSAVRHLNYQSFGFDLGINDQVVWKYSQFQLPITTVDHVPFIPKYYVHIELIYLLISPFYWIWEKARMLLILQAGFVCFSGMAIFFLAKHYKLHILLQFALLFTYLMFYGVQNALWFDAHSSPFGAAFVACFIYFLISNRTKWTVFFFLLAITAKENIPQVTFLITFVYFLVTRNKLAAYLCIASLLYLVIIFSVYFPYIAGGYRFQSSGGLFSNLDPSLMFNTTEKQQVYFYTFLTYGFLPFLNPLYLIPVFGNLASYFILGSNVSTAQGLFLQYRIGLAPLMSWALIETIAKFKWLNNKYVALYLILCTLGVQYILHLPLSYLTKETFWTQPKSVINITQLIQNIPPTSSVVSQNNITPHLTHRDIIFTLYPIKKDFHSHSPCGQITCDWFRWESTPTYLMIDTSEDWDIRHLLADRKDYIQGLKNLEKAGVIEKYKQIGNAVLYKVKVNPDLYP